MADHDKTEKPTPKRKRESRKKGQVAKSTDLNGAVVLVAGLIGLLAIGPAIVSGIADSMRSTFQQISNPGDATSAAGLHALFSAALHTILGAVAPIAGLCLAAGVIVNVAQVSFKPSMTAIKPDFKKINPIMGFRNLFGIRVATEGIKAIAKVSAVGVVVAMALLPQLTNIGASVDTPPAALGILINHSIMGIAERAAIAYLLIGILDFIYQRYRHNKQLKMSKHEIKEESRQQSAPPEVRSAMRRRQLQAARARMMAAIPTGRRRRHEPDALRGRAQLRRKPPRADRGRQGPGPRRQADPPDRRREQRPDRARPAARALAARLRRDRPDDPGRAVRRGGAGARVRLPDGRT